MTIVNIYEAKTQLSKYAERASKGEEIILARNGHPLCRLVPLKTEKQPIRFGTLRGKVWIAGDFDAPLPDDVIAGFEGG